MKRTHLRSKSRLRRKAALRRKTLVKAVNRKRRAKRHAVAFGPQAELCRSLPCFACGAPPPSDPHHLRSRGAGGDDSECVNLCRECHTEFHTVGRAAFEARHGVDIAAHRDALREELERRRHVSDSPSLCGSQEAMDTELPSQGRDTEER